MIEYSMANRSGIGSFKFTKALFILNKERRLEVDDSMWMLPTIQPDRLKHLRPSA